MSRGRTHCGKFCFCHLVVILVPGIRVVTMSALKRREVFRAGTVRDAKPLCGFFADFADASLA